MPQTRGHRHQPRGLKDSPPYLITGEGRPKAMPPRTRAKDTIWVTAGENARPGDSILWERDDNHPDGEVFVVADGRAVEVYPTALVNEKFAAGELERAGEKAIADAKKRAASGAPETADERAARLQQQLEETNARLADAQAEAERLRTTPPEELQPQP